MPRKNRPQPDCVIDGSQQPPLMRCRHCGTTEPLTLPIPVSELAQKAKGFQQEHGLCHMSLKALEQRWRDMSLLPDTWSLSAYNRRVKESRRLYRAILLRKEVLRKKRLAKG